MQRAHNRAHARRGRGLSEVPRWLTRGTLLVVLSFANLNLIWSPDVVPNALFAWTIVRSGNVDFDEFTGPVDAGGIDRQTYYFRACGVSTATGPSTAARSLGGPPPPGLNDHVCSIFPPGMALLALPAYAPLVLAGVAPTDATVLLYMGHLVAAVVEAAATLFLWATVARSVAPGWAFGLVLLYALGTSSRTIASQALWQHAGVHLTVAIALWLVLVERRLTAARAFAAAALLGLGTLIRQTTALVALGLAPRSVRALAASALGFFIGVLPLLVYDQVAFGSPLEQGYGTKPFDNDIAAGLYGLLLSPSRGFLIYQPYLLAALFAFALAWRRPGHVAERLRWLSAVWLGTLLLYATYAEWWGGRVFGPRFLDDQTPILFAACAWGIGQGMLRGRPARWAFSAAAAWSLVLYGAAAFVYDQSWDTRPLNVNFHPERLLDWSDPQWLAVIRALPAGGVRVVAAAALTLLVLALLFRIEALGRAAKASERGRGALPHRLSSAE
ncbi:MAG: hypothetical protein M3O91_03605 [Chloroflexota bacterium]|nr:hypothetical protein [Chloroflexota bacterium]